MYFSTLEYLIEIPKNLTAKRVTLSLSLTFFLILILIIRAVGTIV